MDLYSWFLFTIMENYLQGFLFFLFYSIHLQLLLELRLRDFSGLLKDLYVLYVKRNTILIYLSLSNI